MKSVTQDFRVWFNESGEPAGLMIENGHDTIYVCKRATKAEKDELLADNSVEPII